MRSFKSMVVLVACAAVACDSDSAGPDPDAEVKEVRALTQPFSSVSAAQAAGYTVWSPDPAAANATCASSPDGKMGYHLVNGALRGSPANPAQADATIDYRQPEMLLYEKRPDGQMGLVGVEYLVFKEAWERVKGVGAAPPQVLGQPVPLSRHSFVPNGPEIDHYELHVWLHKENPRGLFAPYHPGVTC